MLQNYFLKENWCELQWSSVLLVWLASDPHIWLEPCCMIHFALFSFQRTPAGFHLLALTWVSFYILLHSAVFVKHFFEVFFKSLLPQKPAVWSSAAVSRKLFTIAGRVPFADDLYYITRFFIPCQHYFRKKFQIPGCSADALCCSSVPEYNAPLYAWGYSPRYYPDA